LITPMGNGTSLTTITSGSSEYTESATFFFIGSLYLRVNAFQAPQDGAFTGNDRTVQIGGESVKHVVDRDLDAVGGLAEAVRDEDYGNGDDQRANGDGEPNIGTRHKQVPFLARNCA
jgi:hypothetical protein